MSSAAFSPPSSAKCKRRRRFNLAVNLVFAAKAIERMGDHIKNIGEHVIFVATGDDVRHGGLDAVTDKSD